MIKSLSLTNFRKHSAVDLYFEDPMQMILISGKNGVGKTTILESILYSLYGESRHGKKHLDQLVKRGTELEGMSVEITLNLNDATYRIHRRRDNKISTAVLYVNDNPLVEGANEVTQEVTKILGLDSAGFKLAVLAQQKELEGLSTLRPSERSSMVSKLLRLDLLAKAKDEAQTVFRKEREIYKELQIITAAEDSTDSLEHLEAHIASLKLDEEQLLAQKYSLLKESKALSHIPQEYQGAQVKLRVAQENLENIIKEIAVVENEIKSIAIPAADPTPTIDLQELTQEIIEVENSISQAEQGEIASKRKTILAEELATLVHQKNTKKEAINSLTKADPKKGKSLIAKKKDKSDKEDKITATSNEIQKFKLLITNNDTIIDNLSEDTSVCQLCNQDVSVAHKELEIKRLNLQNNDLQVTLRKKETLLENINGELISINMEIVTLENILKQAEIDTQKELLISSEVRDIELRIGTLNLQIEQIVVKDYNLQSLYLQKSELAKTANSLQRSLEQNKQRNELLAKSHNLNDKLSDLYVKKNIASSTLEEATIPQELLLSSNKLATFETEISNIDVKINELTSQILVYAEKIAHNHSLGQMNKQRNDRKDIHQQNAINYSNAALLIGDVSESLAQEIRPLLEGHVTNILSLMSNGRFSKVQITEDYDITVFDDNKFRLLAELSGGECDLVSLALRLALSQVVSQRHGSGGCGFLILDECFASQDSERREAVLTSLRNLKDIYHQIFIVSHIEHIDDFVDLVVNVEISEDRSDTEVVCL